MKKSFYSIGSIIILLLAAVIFVLVPAMADSTGTKRSPYPDYGSFNGQAIRYDEGTDFFESVNEVFNYYESMGVDFSSEFASQFYGQIFSQAFTNVVGTKSLEYFTESSGYITPDSAISRSVKNLPDYKDGSGVYSPAKYQSYTEDERRSKQDQVEKGLKQMRSYEDIFGSMEEVGTSPIYGLKTSSNEVEFLRKMGEKQYAFEVAAFNLRDYPADEIESFGKNHKDLFVKYNLRVITCESQSKASEALKRLNNNEITFEDAIAEYSKGYYGDPNTGIISANYKYQIETAFINADDINKVTSLQANEYSPVIETISAYCVFQATEAPVQPQFENNSMNDAVFSYLLTREKSVVESYFVEKAKEFTAKASATSFDSAAKFFNVSVSTVAPSALNYNNGTIVGQSAIASNPDLSGALTNDNFLKTAYSLKSGAVSEPIVLNTADKVVVLKCTGITNGGTPAAEAKALIAPAINQASKESINHAILSSDRIKDNSHEFMAVFNGNKS